MNEQFSRTELLLGADKMQHLYTAKVAIFGIGGVGGFAAEALCRSGIGTLDIFDHDKVDITNINRQIYATMSTIGQYKVDIARARMLDINPNATVNAHKMFYLPETSHQVDLSQYDYVIDAIDTVSGKIELAVNATKSNVPIISSMGAGNKLNITDFEVADIFDTEVCPLAKVMRHELRKRGIEKLKVVYSREPVITPVDGKGFRSEVRIDAESETKKPRCKQPPGSNAFVPAAVGLILAGEVVKDLIK